MPLSFDSEFIFIGKGDESFLENYSYELEDDPAGPLSLFMVLEILNNQAEAEDIGEAIFDNVRQKFFSPESAGSELFHRFEEALKAANETIASLREAKVSRFIGTFNIAVGAVSGSTLLLSAAGDAEVYLIRKNFVSVISEGLAENNKHEVFVNIANGTLESDDRLLFSSCRLLRYITKAEFAKIMAEHRRTGDALAELGDFVATEILGRAAVIGVGVSEAPHLAEVFASQGEAHEQGRLSNLSALLKRLPLPHLSGRTGDVLQKILSQASAGVSALKRLFSGISIRKDGSGLLPRITFHREIPKERLLLGAFLLFALLVTGGFWLRTRGYQARAVAAQQVKLDQAQEFVSEASTVGQFDKAKAAELLANSEKLGIEVMSSGYLRSDAANMLEKIKKDRDAIDEVKRISAPNVLVDLTEKKASPNPLGLVALKEKLYAFEYNALYEIILDKLNAPLTLSDVETAILGADYGDRNALLFLTRTGKMIEYKDGAFSFALTKDGIWKQGVDMKVYNDRVYLLDPKRNQIWRYPKLRDGFDASSGVNQDADLADSISLAIDSSIYVLKKDGTVVQLYQGQKKDFPLRRAPLQKLAAPVRIFTSPETPFLFILEPDQTQNRVLLFRKDPKNGGANYATQYVFENTGRLRDLTVADSRLYVMDDKKVYFVNLNGL